MRDAREPARLRRDRAAPRHRPAGRHACCARPTAPARRRARGRSLAEVVASRPRCAAPPSWRSRARRRAGRCSARCARPGRRPSSTRWTRSAAGSGVEPRLRLRRWASPPRPTACRCGPRLLAYLHAFAANLVSAGVRLVPLGQTDGQRAHRGARRRRSREVADQALAGSLDDLGTRDAAASTGARCATRPSTRGCSAHERLAARPAARRHRRPGRLRQDRAGRRAVQAPARRATTSPSSPTTSTPRRTPSS